MDKEFTEWFEKHRQDFYTGDYDIEQIAFMAWQAAQQNAQRTDATEPPCDVANGCYFGQDGNCLRGGVCR